MTTAQVCEWFTFCTNPAAGNHRHPIIGNVPTCQRCADRFDLALTPLAPIAPAVYSSGQNVAGYLPVDDPFITTDYDAARRHLIDLMECDADGLDALGDHDAAEDLSEQAQDLNLLPEGDGYLFVQSKFKGEHTLPVEYWLTRLPAAGAALWLDENDEETIARRKLRKGLGLDEAQPFPAYAWPGGYPIAYVTDDADVLCAACVNDSSNPVHFDGQGDGWRVDGFDALFEAEDDVRCAHCNVLMLAGE